MDRREAVITGAVVAVACLLITVLVLVARGGDGATVTAPADPGTTEVGPTGDDSGPGVDPLEAFVDEAIAFIEATRGSSFVTRPEVVVLDEDAFVSRLDDDLVSDLADDPEGLAEANAVYRALDLIEPDDDVADIVRAFGAAGILGFYDPVSDELVVRQREELSLLTRSTIVHELTHAFDDQHFDLDREEYDDRTDEVAWTFRAVAEGSAAWVESQWVATLSADDQAALGAEELSYADPGLLTRFSTAFLLLEYSPYAYGEPFVEGRVEAEGTAGLDEVLTTPPDTSEQVMEPSRFAADEQARALEPPPADGEVVVEGVGGAVLIDSLFQGTGVSADIEWGADWLVAWEDGARTCVRWDVSADTVAGFAELATGFAQWARVVGGAEVEQIAQETLRVDRCV